MIKRPYQREKEMQFHCGRMGYGPDLSGKSPRRRPNTKILRSLTVPRDHAGHVTRCAAKVQREALWCDLKIVNVDKTERASAVPKKPGDSSASQFFLEVVALEETMQENQEETSQVKEASCPLTATRTGGTGAADLITQHIVGMKHMAMATMTPREPVFQSSSKL